MHVQKIILISLALLGMLATFLPWTLTPGLPATDGTYGSGWVTFAVYAVVLIVILSGKPAVRVSNFSFTCIALLTILCSVYGILITGRQTSGDINNLTQTNTSIGIGLYLLIIVGFLVPVLGFLLRGNRKTVITKNEVHLNINVKNQDHTENS